MFYSTMILLSHQGIGYRRGYSTFGNAQRDTDKKEAEQFFRNCYKLEARFLKCQYLGFVFEESEQGLDWQDFKFTEKATIVDPVNQDITLSDIDDLFN